MQVSLPLSWTQVSHSPVQEEPPDRCPVAGCPRVRHLYNSRCYRVIDRFNSSRNYVVALPLAIYGLLLLAAKYMLYFNKYLLTQPRKLCGPVRCLWSLFWVDLVQRNHTSKKARATEKLRSKVHRDGYQLREYEVRTADGHLLLVHRILPAQVWAKTARRPLPGLGKTVFLQHGLKCSSADWTVQGLPYRLADLGYDVWLGNFRGNCFSLNHDSLCYQKDSESFWKFSFEEHGKFDLPAMLDFVLKVTRTDKLYYIGHSMGTTALFVMLDYYPERNSQLEHVMALAPVTHLPNVFGIPRWFIPVTHLIMRTLEKLRLPAMMSPKWVPFYCPAAMLVLQATGYHKPDPDSLPEVLTFSPSSTSTRSLIHYIRCSQRGSFSSFDGTRHYSLHNVQCPVEIWWTSDDWASGKTDVAEIAKRLYEVTGVHEIQEPNFGHLDFLWSKEGAKVAGHLVQRLEEVRQGKKTSQCQQNLCQCKILSWNDSITVQ